MTTFTGRVAHRLWPLALLLITLPLRAEVTATLDRHQAAMGDSLRLTITATRDSEDLGDADLRPLLADFEVLQQSTRSNTRIVNGERSHTRQLLLDITPRREGQLTIPPMRVGAGVTNTVQVNVGPAPTGDAEGAVILFEAELDRQQVYVQGQVLLTLRLQQAINLDNRSISELSLDGAFVRPLEQKSFQRTVDGRPWLVHEVRYAIFPEQSGTLEIPAQTFSARERVGRRSLFDRGGNGRLLRRRTDPLTIEVVPRPDSFPGGTWLPARNLEIEESWSAPPEQLRAGESITRTLRLRGEGLQGAQLPPVLFPAQDGVKFYPDQPEIEEREVASGLLGLRVDSTAMVATREGQIELPEIRIPWWDVERGELRYAVLPARRIAVAAAEPASVGDTPEPLAAGDPLPVAPTVAARSAGVFPWHWVALATSLGWLLTLLWLARHHWRRRDAGEPRVQEQHPSEQRAFKQLLAACAGNSPALARQALLDWWRSAAQMESGGSTAQVAAWFADKDLTDALDALDRSLYAGAGNAATWQGETLANIVRRLRKTVADRRPDTAPKLELYPAA